MAGNIIDAQAALFAVVETAWNANRAAIFGGAVPLYDWHLVGDKRPSGTPAPAAFGRVKVLNTAGGNRSIGRKHYENRGRLFVQVFVLESAADHANRAMQMGVAMSKALKNANTICELTEIASSEVGRDGPWFQLNTTAAFTFEEFTS